VNSLAAFFIQPQWDRNLVHAQRWSQRCSRCV